MSSDLQQNGTDAGVAERGKQVAAQATDAARTVATEATEQAKAVVGEAKHEMQRMVDQTRHEVGLRAREEGQRAAQGLRTLSQQVDALASGRPQEAGQLGTYLRDAEHRLNMVAERIETGGPQAVLDDVARFARRRPGMFLAVAAGAGFLAGRLARSGAAARQEQQSWSNGARGLPPATDMAAPDLNAPPTWNPPVQSGYTA